jgi:polysaccharide export outer membrane protein
MCPLAAQQKASEPPGANDLAQPSGRIGPDDLIAITVYDAPDLSRKLRVSGDGTIRLPLVPEPVHAAGLTPEELEKAVASAFRNGQILVQPSVAVSVLQYTSRPISVAGAVRHPLTFDASGKVTLLNAITKAEGLTPEAGPEIVLSTPAPAGGTPGVQHIRVKELMDGSHPELNVSLQGGEEVRVSEAPKIFVMGNVKKPGSYTVQDSVDMTVLKVLALAGGDLPFTQKQAYIYRQAPDGKNKTEIPFNLRQVLDRKAPDVALSPNDLLYVLDNKSRRLTLGTLDRLAGYGAATASGVLIWRH